MRSLLFVLLYGSVHAADAPGEAPIDSETETGPAVDTDAEDTDAPEVDPRFSRCPEPSELVTVRATVATIAVAAQARDLTSFQPAYDTLVDQVDCLETVVHPRDAAALHGARYLDVAAEGDQDAMALALLATSSVPGATMPEWLPVPASADIAEAKPWVRVAVPDGMHLFVDGVPARARPVDRPALVQAVGPGAEVLWTAWIGPGESLPMDAEEGAGPSEGPDPEGRALLERVTDLLAQGSYPAVVELAVPAASKYPELATSFQAAADLAVDQIERERLAPSLSSTLGGAYPSRIRRGSERRGDDRKGFLLGFDLGFPTGVRGEWKLGGTAADGVGVRVGGNMMFASAGSVYTGTETSLYMDWNLTRKWQLETQLGLFISNSGSAYPTIGAAVQYDPPSPLQVTGGLRLSNYGYVVPEASVGFLW